MSGATFDPNTSALEFLSPWGQTAAHRENQVNCVSL